MQLDTLFVGFILVAILVLLGFMFVINTLFKTTALQRLHRMAAQERALLGLEQTVRSEAHSFLKKNISPLARFSQSSQPWENSTLRQDLMAAGFRTETAGKIYLGLKTFSTLLWPLLFLLGVLLLQLDLNRETLFYLLPGWAAAGYVLPNLVLGYLIRRRQEELQANFSDALDLMRICVEAGLALDVAIVRVGEEMRIRSKVLSDELRLVALEQRAGSTRMQALGNLAARVRIKEIDALVSTLVQAEKFGTSIADSLKIHSESLRLNRRMEAEEHAAKIPTKILLPLVVFIFPVLFILILTPAIGNVRHALNGSETSAASSHP